MHEFFEWTKAIIILLIPVISAYIAWRQREAELQMIAMRKDVKEVKMDADVLKAVGNSTLREAMQATVVATQGLAVVTNSKDDHIAASQAKQRLAEHDRAQTAGKVERDKGAV